MKRILIILLLTFSVNCIIEAAENIKLLTPSGGESVYFDDNVTITWIGGEDNDYVDLEYYNIKENEWNSIADSVESNLGINEYNWSTPDEDGIVYMIVRLKSEDIKSQSLKYFKMSVKPSPKMVKRIEEITDNINIFPSPTSDILNISVADKGYTHIKIFNSNGTIVKSTIFSEHINVSDLSTGIYLLYLESSNEVRTSKFVISK